MHECPYVWMLLSVFLHLCLNVQIYICIKFTFVLECIISLCPYMVAYGQRDRISIPGSILSKTQKWYLMRLCLTLVFIMERIKSKLSNPGKGLMPSP